MTEGLLHVEYLLNGQVTVQRKMNQFELAALLTEKNVMLLSVNRSQGKRHRKVKKA